MFGVIGWKVEAVAIILALVPLPSGKAVAGMPQKKLGLSLAVDPKTSPASLKPSPQVLLLNWWRNSSATAVFGEAVDAGAEALLLAADGAVERGIADRAPELVVEAVAEVRGAGVGVPGAPAAEDDLADVGLVVAVGVLEEQGLRGVVRRRRRRWRRSGRSGC